MAIEKLFVSLFVGEIASFVALVLAVVVAACEEILSLHPVFLFCLMQCLFHAGVAPIIDCLPRGVHFLGTAVTATLHVGFLMPLTAILDLTPV